MGKLPQIHLHKASGQARIKLKGKHFYLGPYGSQEAHQKYNAIVEQVVSGKPPKRTTGLSMAVAAVQYLDYVKTYYGEKSKETGNIQSSLRTLAKEFGRVEVANLGPAILTKFFLKLADKGNTRAMINRTLMHLKRFYKWLVVAELTTPEKLSAILAIPGIKTGRTNAVELPRVKAPPIEDFHKLVAVAPPHVADLLNLQLLLACRPGELVAMKPALVDRTKPVWVYTPNKHKNQHRGHQRKILIGPKAQAILAKYLFRGDDEYCWPSEKMFDSHYQVHSYEQELKRLSQRAGIEKILPNQIRHLAATVIHERYGWEAARQMLGHKTVGTTQFYVEELLTGAGKVASEIG